jgi:hypothetical protein
MTAMRGWLVGIGLLSLLLSGCVAGIREAPPAAPLALAVSTPAGRIVGWVFADGDGDRELDVGETLLEALVSATGADSALTQATVVGWYGFTGVADGTWQVGAMAPGYVCEQRSATVAATKVTVNVPCTLTLTPTPTPTIPILGTPTPAANGLTWEPLPGLCGRVCVAGLPEVGCWDVCLDTSYRVMKAGG